MDRLYWALLDSVVGYLGDGSAGDYSDSATIVIAGDSLAPAAPTFSLSPKSEAIELTISPPATNADGTTCVDFKEYGIYYSASASIDIADSGSYDGLYTVAGSKTEATHHTHPTKETTYFVVTAYDTFGNQSAAAAEASASPDTATVNSGNIVPNPYFGNDADGDGIPDDWSLQAGWIRSTDAYQGSYSIAGQGSGISAISSRVTLPSSYGGLAISGVAKTQGTSFSLYEVASAATTSAPIAFCDASGDIAAIARQNAGYDIIELWDVSNPASPAKAGSIDASGSTSHRSKPFRIYDTYLICGDQGAQYLYIYDISDPASPSLTSTYTLANATGRLAALAVRDWTVYACCDDDTNGGFIESIDIRIPSSPVQLDVVNSVTATGEDFSSARAANGVLYVASSNAAMYVSPTSVNDANSWLSPEKAYDGLTGSSFRAYHQNVSPYQYSTSLILNVPSASYSGVRFYADAVAGQCDYADVQVYYGGAWHDVYSDYHADETWVTITFSAQTISRVRFAVYNSDPADDRTAYLREIQMICNGGLFVYNISDPSSMTQYDTVPLYALKDVVPAGAYLYATCTDGAVANQILVFDVSAPASCSHLTSVGGAGAPNYTGSDALFMSSGYLVNVGAGSDAAKYAVSYWDISAPDLPVLESVNEAVVGDLDAADETGGLIVGVDVDNSKVRVVDPQIAADWEFRVQFYDASDTLIESITAYDGDSDLPCTGESWTVFSQTIPEADIPNAAKKVEFVCYCNESTGSVYVDSLSAEFET